MIKAKTICLSNTMKNIFAFISMFILLNTASAQSFQNGDLEGVVNGFSSLPDFWLNVPYTDVNCLASQTVNDTPDLTSLSAPIVSLGFNGNPFSGNTFVGGGFVNNINPSSFTQEGIMQTVSGFTIGKKYSIHFRQTVAKTFNCLDKSGSWAVYFDTILAGITSATYSNEPFSSNNLNWEARSVTFTATATSLLIKFLPMDDDTNYFASTTDTTGALYMGIDSIGLDLLTGINEVNVDNGFKVFPNPNNGSFTLSYKENITAPTNLIITDALGQIVDEVSIANATTHYQNNNLSNGLYFYGIRQNNSEIARGKILIQK